MMSNTYDEIAQVIVSNPNCYRHFQTIGLFEDSNSLENGWVKILVGYFWKVGDEDWLFSEKLRWIFMKRDNSIWVWIQKMNGWFGPQNATPPTF